METIETLLRGVPFFEGMTDEGVETYYSCTLCQSFAPTHVCVISPERTGLCGAYNWLDCKASYSINPTGPNQPIKLGSTVDSQKGYWSGTNEYAKIGSHGADGLFEAIRRDVGAEIDDVVATPTQEEREH